MKMRLVVMVICALLITQWAYAAGGQEVATESQPVQLQYWSSGGGERHINAIMDNLAEEFPEIEIEVFQSGHADFWKKMTVALASDTGPDMCHSKNFYMIEFAAKGALKELDTLYERDYAEIGPDTDPLFKNRIETECRLNGKLYGLPMYSWWIVFMYNEDLLDGAGIAAPPNTWAELRAYATKLTKDTTGDGVVDQWGTKMYAYSRSEIPQFNWSFNQFVLQNGLDMVELSANSRPTYRFNAPEAKEALEFWVDNMYKHQNTMPPELAEKDATKIIENGKLGMWYMGQWAYNRYPETAPDLKWKISPIPMRKSSTTIVEGHTGFVVKTSKHPEEAWNVLKYMTSIEGDLAAQRVAGYMPIRDQNWKKEPWSVREDYLATIDQVQNYDAWVQPLYPGMTQQLSKSAEILQEAFYNRGSVESVLNKMQSEVTKLVK
jgi:multiple sugar transport system substrate-binding protein